MGKAALIERLEKLTGPDRETDCALAVTLDGFEVHTDSVGRKGRYVIVTDDEIVWPGNSATMLVPEYTASLDAAVALAERVLPDWIWDVSSTGAAWVMGPHDGQHFHVTQKPSPAIALLITILKAQP